MMEAARDAAQTTRQEPSPAMYAIDSFLAVGANLS